MLLAFPFRVHTLLCLVSWYAFYGRFGVCSSFSSPHCRLYSTCSTCPHVGRTFCPHSCTASPLASPWPFAYWHCTCLVHCMVAAAGPCALASLSRMLLHRRWFHTLLCSWALALVSCMVLFAWVWAPCPGPCDLVCCPVIACVLCLMAGCFALRCCCLGLLSCSCTCAAIMLCLMSGSPCW